MNSNTPIVLKLEGLGHVPSFKNNKMIARGKLITNPKRQEWMRRCEASFVSQLTYLYQTTETVMPMVRSLRSWIACVIPLNDSVGSIPDIHIKVHQVPKGKEGAVITIERIS